MDGGIDYGLEVREEAGYRPTLLRPGICPVLLSNFVALPIMREPHLDALQMPLRKKHDLSSAASATAIPDKERHPVGPRSSQNSTRLALAHTPFCSHPV